MRPYVGIKTYDEYLYDEAGNYHKFRCCLPLGREQYKAYHLRERLGGYPKNGSGPYFGAVVDESAQSDWGPFPGYPDWKLMFQGYFQARKAPNGRDFTCIVHRGQYYAHIDMAPGTGQGTSYGQAGGRLWIANYYSGQASTSGPFTRVDFTLRTDKGIRLPADQWEITTIIFEAWFYSDWKTTNLDSRGPSWASSCYIRVNDHRGENYFPRYSHQRHIYDTMSGFLKHDELEVARMLTAGYSSNYVYSGLNAALNAAVENLPQSEVNTIANVLDLVGLVSDLIQGKLHFVLPKLKQLPKKAQDLWLFYRYVFNTSKSDLGEYVELTKRLTDIVSAPKLTTYGQYYDGEYRFQCGITLSGDSILPKDMADWLRTYGVKVSAVNYWDLIPYSFVVDWFFNIGNILQYLETNSRNLAYRKAACWYSIETNYDGISTYTRLMGDHVPRFPAAFHFRTARSRTVWMRLADGVCLFGR